MEKYQREFIEFALQQKALLFGDFVLKSGRRSPYFFNMGCFDTGAALAKIGRFYAEAILHSGIEFDLLFGAAYKGIFLVTAVVMALAEHYGINKPYCFNRKETKDHGEGGVFVGAPLKGKVLMIDDVITAGVTTHQIVSMIQKTEATLTGAVIAIDRQERAEGKGSAVQNLEQKYGFPIVPIIRMEHLLEYLRQEGEHQCLQRMMEYRQQFAVVESR